MLPYLLDLVVHHRFQHASPFKDASNFFQQHLRGCGLHFNSDLDMGDHRIRIIVETQTARKRFSQLNCPKCGR
jgi:hypothetical protein